MIKLNTHQILYRSKHTKKQKRKCKKVKSEIMWKMAAVEKKMYWRTKNSLKKWRNILFYLTKIIKITWRNTLIVSLQKSITNIKLSFSFMLFFLRLRVMQNALQFPLFLCLRVTQIALQLPLFSFFFSTENLDGLTKVDCRIF